MLTFVPFNSRRGRNLGTYATWFGVATVLVCASPAQAQEDLFLNEDCTVHLLNQSVHVSPDGNWRLPNVPSNGGKIRARLNCNSPFGVRRGQSDFFEIQPNQLNTIKSIPFVDVSPGPTRLSVAAEKTALTVENETVQIVVTGLYGNDETKDLSNGSTGTNYRSSNPGVATVTDDGLVTAHVSGNVLIAAWNEAITSAIRIQVKLGPDKDNDGLPDDYELKWGLDPTDPVDARVDHDGDNLNALREFQHGTDPFDADTDDDTIADGEEVEAGEDGWTTLPTQSDTDNDRIHDNVEIMVGTDPTDPNSYNLSASLQSIEVRPKKLTLYFNTLYGEAMGLLRVTGVQLDGTGTSLTDHSETTYSSGNTDIASFGTTKGEVFAGVAGATTIQVSVALHQATIPVIVETFEPKALAMMNLGCIGRRVELVGHQVMVACGGDGIRTVDISIPNEPIMNGIFTDQAIRDVTESGNSLWAASEDLLRWTISDAGVVQVTASLPLGGPVQAVAETADGLAACLDDGTLVMVNDDSSPPSILSSTATGLTGCVDLAADGSRLIVADTESLRLVDSSNPAAPMLQGQFTSNPENGTFSLLTVDLLGDLAVLAIGHKGIKLLNVADPQQPVAVSQLGIPVLVARGAVLHDSLVFAADTFRVNSVPIVQVQNPANPFLASLIEFSMYADSNGQAIDVDSQLVALTTSDRRLYIGQHNKLVDTAGIAPVCTLLQPSYPVKLAQGVKRTVQVSALDDVLVDKVVITVDGQPVAEDKQVPFSVKIQLPNEKDVSVLLGAYAVDSAGNVGHCDPVQITLIEDPMTTVFGVVTGEDGIPVNEALVTVLGFEMTGTTDATGAFSIPGVPTTDEIRVFASAELADVALGGQAGPVAPSYLGQPTNMGTIVLDGYKKALRMGPVVSKAVLFESYTPAYGSEPVTTMGPVVSKAVLFESYTPAYGSEPVTTMGPVVSKAVLFESYTPAYGSELVTTMGPVVSEAVLFESYTPAYGSEPVTTMGPVVSLPVLFMNEPFIWTLSPTSISRTGGTQTVVLTGAGLSGITDVSVFKSGVLDTTIAATIVDVSSDGTTITLAVTPEPTTSLSPVRVLVVTSDVGTSQEVSTGGDANTLGIEP